MTLLYPDGDGGNADVVRPGTSAALTARTIDATVKSPLGRAHDAVATIVPTLAAQAPSPLLIGTLGVTFALAFVVTRRMHLRPTAFLSGALMLLPLSSHQPPPGAADFRKDGNSFVSADQYAQGVTEPPRNVTVALPMETRQPSDEMVPTVAEPPTPTAIEDYSMPSIHMVIPAEELELLAERGRAVRDQALQMARQVYAERQRIRREIIRMGMREQLYQLEQSEWHERHVASRGRR
jgi:hypothetical protein